MSLIDSSNAQTNPRKERKGLRIIDCDIHHNFKNINELFPYLPRKYKERIELWGPGLGGGPGTMNGGKGGRRADSFPPGGGPAGSDIEFMTGQLLDPFNISYGVLTGEFMGCTFTADTYYSAALCSAFNDFTILHCRHISPVFRFRLHRFRLLQKNLIRMQSATLKAACTRIRCPKR